MRFTHPQDYQTILKINQELVNKVVDVTAVIYKVDQVGTKTNSYGESMKKSYFPGIQVPCLIQLNPTNPTAAMGTTDVEQEVEFAFLREELNQRNIYPEVGDIIDFNHSYYEVNNTNEIQLFAGRVEYNHCILCAAHLTRNSAVQLEPPQL
jgi:predicted RNA-binding protein